MEIGYVDLLDELVDVVKELGCWFYVDVVWGGVMLFLQFYCYIMKGIEWVDFVIIDVYKQMYVFMGVGMILFKNFEYVNVVCYYVQYIFWEGLKDFGVIMLEGLCNGMVMMVYLLLYILGCCGYELLIN